MSGIGELRGSKFGVGYGTTVVYILNRLKSSRFYFYFLRLQRYLFYKKKNSRILIKILTFVFYKINIKMDKFVCHVTENKEIK